LFCVQQPQLFPSQYLSVPAGHCIFIVPDATLRDFSPGCVLSGALAILGDGAVSSAGFDAGLAADTTAGADTDSDASLS
jgi:hypothetical protein